MVCYTIPGEHHGVFRRFPKSSLETRLIHSPSILYVLRYCARVTTTHVVQDAGVAARAFIPDAPVSNRQGYHPELLIYACIGKERATLLNYDTAFDLRQIGASINGPALTASPPAQVQHHSLTDWASRVPEERSVCLRHKFGGSSWLHCHLENVARKAAQNSAISNG